MIEIAVGEIHLWLAFCGRADERVDKEYRALLSVSERDSELRFRFASDRRRYLVTRALLRTVLSRYIKIEPRDWVFSTNEHGRPEIANSEALSHRMSFNISHARSLVVLGLCRCRVLGMDVENIGNRAVSLDIADQFFGPEEVATLSTMPAPRQRYRFFEYWTFKEAYIKARGMGLSLPLDKFSFHYPDKDSVAITIDPVLADDAGRWQFWQFMPAPEYLVAVCAECVAARSSVVVRTVDSLDGESMIFPTFLRTSP